MSEVTNYMQSYADYFWHYEDGGKVIAVPDGHTLAYSELLAKENNSLSRDARSA